MNRSARCQRARTGTLAVALLIACGTARDGAAAPPTTQPDARPTIVRPVAKAQTDPVPHAGDAADDPAIWHHPTDPDRSLILGTDKLNGLIVYDVNGRQRQVVGKDARTNNVDVLYDFKLGERVVDLAVVSARDRGSLGVKVFTIDRETCDLADATGGGVLLVLGGAPPYGLCTYRSRKTGAGYFFVTGLNGQIEQHELLDAGNGRIASRPVRRLKLPSLCEGCVADDELGLFYVAEERAGIWRFAADPDGGQTGKLIARVGQNGLTADIEGLTLYAPPIRPGDEGPARGYLIASSQGSSTFLVYERAGENRYVLTIDPAAGQIDDVSDTDGIAVTHRPLGKAFPAGALVVHDGNNAGGNQNFKIYDWRDIAGDRLIVDPGTEDKEQGKP